MALPIFFFKDVVVRDWDVAAPQIILEEAGGVLTDIYGHQMPYEGDYERAGVVAAHSDKSGMRLVSWYAEHSRNS